MLEFMEDISVPRNPFQTDIYYAGNLIISGVMKVSKEKLGTLKLRAASVLEMSRSEVYAI